MKSSTQYPRAGSGPEELLHKELKSLTVPEEACA
jgi:hypothetical protein